MTDTPRRRGRPTKEEAAARAAAAHDEQKKQAKEDEFLDLKLAEPLKKRKGMLEPDEDTLRTLFELGKLFCTQDEAAAVLGCSKRTLAYFFAECEIARDTWDDGLQHAKVSLRRKQMALADKNAPASIFLGKNYLGQKDETTVNQNITKDVKKMSEAQLEEIASRGQRTDEKAKTHH
jgi:hypothetical protein